MSASEKCPACGTMNPPPDHQCAPKDVAAEIMRKAEAGTPRGWRFALHIFPVALAWGMYQSGSTLTESLAALLILGGMIEGVRWIVRVLRRGA